MIAATVNGSGDGSTGGKVSFDPQKEHTRPGLLLENGRGVIAWASHCDNGPYHGWMMPSPCWRSDSLETATAFSMMNCRR